jgi:hypothetical protein
MPGSSRYDFECRSAKATRFLLRRVAAALVLLVLVCMVGWSLYASRRHAAQRDDELARQTSEPQAAMQAPELNQRAPLPVVALCIGCATVGVFYFWLIIRVISRRERWAKRTAAALSIVALLCSRTPPASVRSQG